MAVAGTGSGAGSARTMDRSRDLLYGVIALQMSFVTKEQFVEIMTLLPNRPDDSAQSLFSSRGYLDAKQSDALGRLLEVKLERSGDAAKSIALLHTDPTVAQSLAMLDIGSLALSLASSTGSAAPAPAPQVASQQVEETALITPGETGARYALGAELGRGGVGRVVLAIDRSLMGREVAMKLLRQDRDKQGSDETARARFLEEAQVTARLWHPNIVPVFELGTSPESGELYYTMPVVRGRTFKTDIRDAHSRRAELAPDEWSVERMRLLTAFQGVCHAIAYAHSRNVIHRDIKPHNVMLGEFGETIVLDWGLAKVLVRSAGDPERSTLSMKEGREATAAPRTGTGSDEELARIIQTLRAKKGYKTLEGSIAGTPSYMPPEQAEGRISDVDERSDVYSLGAVLFEILTGVAPYAGVDSAVILYRVVAGPSPDPRDSGGGDVDDDIAGICMKAMSRDKRDRYPSVVHLSREIALYMEGAKERARRREKARQLTVAGADKVAEYASLSGEVKRLESVAAHLGRSFLGNEPIEAKIGVWDVEDRASAGKRAAAKALAEAERSFHKALEWEAGNPDARRGLADIYYDQFRDAEAARNEDDLDYYRELVESYHDGRYARELQGDGTLTVTTDPPGAQVFVYRYEVKQRRTIPVPWKSEAGAAARETVPAAAGLHLRPNAKDKTAHAGTAPLAGVPIPMGSYLLILRLPKYRDVRVPVRIARNQDADVRVRLYTEQEIGRGFVYVPGGEYVAGGDARVESSWERHVRNVPDFFVGRFPVTCREYLQFLNDLGSREPEEARRHAPKPPEGKELWLERAQGKWSLPTEKTPDVAWAWAPDLPVVFISWDDAVAYCAWRSKREGRRVRLPREEEREKACRGVDERWFPWGNHFDATWCNMVDSRPAGTAMLEAVGSHDVDESPYGARDLAGNVFDWCSDVFQDGKAWRALRGGAFEAGKLWSRSAARVGFLPTMRFSAAGLRVVCDPPASPGR